MINKIMNQIPFQSRVFQKNSEYLDENQKEQFSKAFDTLKNNGVNDEVYFTFNIVDEVPRSVDITVKKSGVNRWGQPLVGNNFLLMNNLTNQDILDSYKFAGKDIYSYKRKRTY